MPVLPLMPGEADQVATPMPGGGAPTMAPPVGGGGGDLASLLGIGGNGMLPGGIDPIQMGLGQFDTLGQIIQDISRTFPGSEMFATQMSELLDQWRQQVLLMTTPPPSAMPGADQMM